MSGLFPEDFIEQVRNANDIVEVIGSCVPLKRAGASFKGISPFTKEKTPSFFVNPDKQVFYCFSSGQGGDIFRFLMVYEGLKFTEAVERLAERAKLPLPKMERSGRSSEEGGGKAHLIEVQEKVRDWYHSLLMRSPAAAGARDYLKSRQLSAETARRFRIGYSPNQWDGLIQWTRRGKIPLETLEKLGLIVMGKGGHYDRFRDRLMIPIQNEQGKTVGFTARLLSAGAKEAKYVNSPETELFSKGKLLFGLDRAKRALMDQRTAVLCEGQIDCITCQEHGVENTIAPQGTAFTDYQARILKRYVDEVILCFDSDSAGSNATYRNIFVLLREGLRVKSVCLPMGYDPDSYIKEKGAEAFKTLVSTAPTVFNWLAPRYDWNDASGRMGAAQQIGELWCAISDEIYQEFILEQMQKLTGVPHPTLRRIFLEKHDASAPRPREVSIKRDRKGSNIEETLLAYCLLSESTAGYVLGHVEKEWLEEGFLKDWLLEIFQKMEEEGWEAARVIPDTPEGEEKQRIRARLFTMTLHHGKEALAYLKECMRSLQLRYLAAKIRAKHEEFRQTQDPAQKERIQREIHDFEKMEHDMRIKT